MPASQLQWSPVRPAPIFPVYGHKRKAAENPEEAQGFLNPQQGTEGFVAKRRCIWTNNHQQDQSMGASSSCFGQFLPSQPPQDQAVSLPTHAANMEINHNDVQVTNQHLQEEQAVGGIMELGDETYNMEAAQASMDSDFVPDTHQYNQPNSAAASMTEQAEQAGDTFCKQYCGAGDESPNSGRVRCYCKPSWEGMLNTRPYISDVY